MEFGEFFSATRGQCPTVGGRSDNDAWLFMVQNTRTVAWVETLQ